MREWARRKRAIHEKDELVRETRRLSDVVVSLPRIDESEREEAASEIGGATSEIEAIDELAEVLDEGAADDRGAVVAELAETASLARRRRRRVRDVRRRLLREQGDLAA